MKVFFKLFIFFSLNLGIIWALDGIELSKDDSLFLRRIDEYVQTKETQMAKKEILEYIEKCKERPLNQFLNSLLGDIYFQEGDFSNAFETYEKVNVERLKKKICVSSLRCLYEMKKFDLVLERAKACQETYLNDPEFVWVYADSLLAKSKESKESKYLGEAKVLFEKLYQIESTLQPKYKLAEIFEDLGELEKSATIYLELAQKDLEEKENLLFYAAELFSKVTSSKAIEIFDQIIEMNQNKAKEAAFNKLILLFNDKLYDQVLVDAKKYTKIFIGDQSILFRYFIAKTHLAKGNYPLAVKQAQRILKIHDQKDEWMHNAILILAEAANFLQDEQIYDTALKYFSTYYPSDEQRASLLLSRAYFLKKNQRWEEALKDIENLETLFPEQKEINYKFEKAQIYYMMNQFEKSVELLETLYLEKIDPFLKNQTLRSLVNCYQKLFFDQKSTLLQEKLFFYLQEFLAQKDFLTEEERQQHLLLLSKIHYEIHNIDQSIGFLQTLLQEPNKERILGRASYLLGLCFLEKNHDLGAFLLEEEKALGAKDVPLEDVHLAIFNALILEKKQDQALLKKAAFHLYEAFKLVKIQESNLLWLGDYYYDESIKEKDKSSSLKALEIYTSFLMDPKDENHFISHPDYEDRVFVLFDLLETKEKKLALLERLRSVYEKNPNHPWELKSKAYYWLGSIYYENNEIEKAVACFQEILKNPNIENMPLVSLYSLREKRKELLLNNEASFAKMEGLLKELKNIKILKNFKTEPAHLEAAIEYVELKMELSTKKSPEEELLLWNEVKLDFTQEKDIISRTYHEERRLNLEKNQKMQTYLSYIEGKILILESKIKQNPELCEKGLEIFKKLKEDKSLSKFLQDRLIQREKTVNLA